MCECVLSFHCVLSQGCYFIDRSPKCFGYVLDYLRGGDIVLPEDQSELRRIWIEAEYYQLEGLKLLLKEHGLPPEKVVRMGAEERQLIKSLDNVFSVISEKEPSSHGLFRIGGIVTASITARFQKDNGQSSQRNPFCRMTDKIQLGVRTVMGSKFRHVSSTQVHCPSLTCLCAFSSNGMQQLMSGRSQCNGRNSWHPPPPFFLVVIRW